MLASDMIGLDTKFQYWRGILANDEIMIFRSEIRRRASV